MDGPEDLLAVLKPLHEGEVLTIRFRQRGEDREAELVRKADPRLAVLTFESAGLEVTDEILRFREDWLGPRRKRDHDAARHQSTSPP